ncbi:hypothetical protein B9Z55_023541 [Caenorhabditis nigoni]|uniref:Uncharacterized protein n=1 Tax=Caenorhabditis nigoni TaxID=1611254 RepID=A0A2G5SQM6_9PELO|nr:hypothetical protein B9Z55_023541 [Caenorhabditis nigoni]
MNTRPSQSFRLSGPGSRNRDENEMRNSLLLQERLLQQQHGDRFSNVPDQFNACFSSGVTSKGHSVVLEKVLVRFKEFILMVPPKNEDNGEDHPPNAANTDVIKEKQALKTAQERKVLTGKFTGDRAINESPDKDRVRVIRSEATNMGRYVIVADKPFYTLHTDCPEDFHTSTDTSRVDQDEAVTQATPSGTTTHHVISTSIERRQKAKLHDAFLFLQSTAQTVIGLDRFTVTVDGRRVLTNRTATCSSRDWMTTSSRTQQHRVHHMKDSPHVLQKFSTNDSDNQPTW